MPACRSVRRCRHPSQRVPARARGLALIAVLWIVAALSLLVLAATASVRQQIQATAAVQDQVQGQAQGEAAIALALQGMTLDSARFQGQAQVTVPWNGVAIGVHVASLNGLISLGGANVPLLTALLHVAGGLPAGQAQALATTIVAWRDGRPEVDPTAPGGARAGSQTRGIEAPEDLLLIPGMDYAIYARIAPLVTADLGSDSRVNLGAAPPGVLAVLAGGNLAVVQRYLGDRARNGVAADASGFNPAFVGTGGGGLYRLQASVPLGAGKILLLTQDVALGSGYSAAGPWRLMHSASRIAPAAARPD